MHVFDESIVFSFRGWSYLGANQMAHLRVHRANGVNLSQIHIGQSTKKEKLIISESLPQQALASLSTAVGSSFETLGNIPSLSRAAQGWGPLLRRIANAAFDF